MKKVLFLYYKHPVEPLGIMYLSAILKNEGHKTKVALIGENVEEKIEEFKPDVIAGSVTTGFHTTFLELIKNLKEKYNFLSLVGGSHPTFHPEIINEEGVDIIVRGEADESIRELINSLDEGQEVTHIPNIWIKKNGKIYQNPLRDLMLDLDALPFPDREIVYEYDLWKNEPIRHFIASRGCPYKCTYCFNHSMVKLYEGKGKWLRLRSVDSLIKEVKETMTKYGGKFVYFQDDTFNINKEWLKDFSKKYKEEVNIPYHCHLRANLVDEEVVGLLKDSNCYSVHLALETADDSLRNDVLKRSMSKLQVYDACNLLNKYGIKIMLQNMIGLPGSDLKKDLETLKMNIKCKPLYGWVSIFQPYPGTELTEYAKENGFLEESFNEIQTKFFETTVLNLEHKKQIENLQKLFGLTVSYPIIFYSGLLYLLIHLPRTKLIKKIYSWIYKRHRDRKDNQLYGLKLH